MGSKAHTNHNVPSFDSKILKSFSLPPSSRITNISIALTSKSDCSASTKISSNRPFSNISVKTSTRFCDNKNNLGIKETKKWRNISIIHLDIFQMELFSLCTDYRMVLFFEPAQKILQNVASEAASKGRIRTHHSSSLWATKNSFNCCLLNSSLYSLYFLRASSSLTLSSKVLMKAFKDIIGGWDSTFGSGAGVGAGGTL